VSTYFVRDPVIQKAEAEQKLDTAWTLAQLATEAFQRDTDWPNVLVLEAALRLIDETEALAEEWR